MKLTVKNTTGKRVKIKDSMGKEILYIFSYDTKTKKAGLFLLTGNSKKGSFIVGNKNGKGYPIIANVKIPGSYAEINGKVVK